MNEINSGLKSLKWTVKGGLIMYKGKAYVSPKSPLIEVIVAAVHNSHHEVYLKTLKRIEHDFWWKEMRDDIMQFVRNCEICKKNKVDSLKPAGLLQPLPIPQQVWSDLSMDFIEGLPSSHGKKVILVVVDRLSKYAHFMALNHPYTAVARLFFDNVVKLHGFP